METKYQINIENFEGPFDLLLYLIKKEEMDIYDIPIARITNQFLDYINSVKILDLNNAGEFLIMASSLMQIKSKMLLPIEKVSLEDELGKDPRDELVARLMEYKKYKEIAGQLKTKESHQNNLFHCKISSQSEKNDDMLFEATLFDLVNAFNKIYVEGVQEKTYDIKQMAYKVEDKIELILENLEQTRNMNLNTLFLNCTHKVEIVVTFLALLELIKRKQITAWQSKLFGEIWLSKNENKYQEELPLNVPIE